MDSFHFISFHFWLLAFNFFDSPSDDSWLFGGFAFDAWWSQRRKRAKANSRGRKGSFWFCCLLLFAGWFVISLGCCPSSKGTLRRAQKDRRGAATTATEKDAGFYRGAHGCTTGGAGGLEEHERIVEKAFSPNFRWAGQDEDEGLCCLFICVCTNVFGKLCTWTP